MSKLLPGQGSGTSSGPTQAARKTPATALNPQFQPYSVLRAIWKQKYAAAAIWVLMTALTVFVVLQLPRTYEAQASVLVGGTTLSKDMVASTVTTEMHDRMEQIRQRVMSRDSLMRIMETFHLHEGDRKAMPPERVGSV